MSSPVLVPRFAAIDETRAFAIITMMIMHFGPGVFQRLPALAPLAEPVLLLGRLATTTFILVFGITIGFVYHDRFQGPDRPQVLKAIQARSRLLALCALVICIPNYIDLWLASDFDFHHWLFKTYSILNYYVLALLSVPLWLRVLGQVPLRNALLLGVGYWALALLWLPLWPQDSILGLREYLRLNLLSGPYGYLQLSGSAIMAIPVGIGLRKAVRLAQERAFLRQLLPVALCLSVIGFVLGLASGELSLYAIVSGTVKTPPRVWYWLFFAGLAFLLLTGFIALGLKLGTQGKRLISPLALFGQASLPIYTAHTFVLPILHWLDHLIVVEGMIRILLPFMVFAVYCVLVMEYHRRKMLRSHVA